MQTYLKTATLSGIYKFCLLLLQFLLVRLIVVRVNSDIYGVWLTLYGFLVWINMMDLGISQGFRNLITNSVLEKGDLNLIIRTFMSANLLISIALIAGYVVLRKFANISIFLGSIDNESLDMFAVLVIVQFVSRGINTVYHGKVMSHIVDLIQLIGFLGVLISYYIVSSIAIEINISLLIGIYLIPPIITQIVAWRLLKFSNGILFIGSINWSMLLGVIGDSSRLFVTQLVAVLLYSTVNIVILNLVGSEAVVQFGLSYRVFSVFLIVNSILMAPLWSHAAVLWRTEDKVMIRRILQKLLLIWFGLLIALLLVSYFTNDIILLWTSNDYSVSSVNIISMVLYVGIMMLTGIFSNILNGIGDFQFQMKVGLIQLVSVVLISISFKGYLDDIWNYLLILDLAMLGGALGLFSRLHNILSHDL